jgi:hypothetical protein
VHEERNEMADPKNPVKINRFRLDLQEAGKMKEVGTFSELAGLEFEIQPMDGVGVNQKAVAVQAKRPGFVSAPRQLTFKTQVVSDAMWAWWKSTWDKPNGAMADGSVVLLDAEWKETARFNFEKGWPSKITWTGLDAKSTDPIAIEVTLQVQNLTAA